ncbi:hypothetical protein [Chitinophaga sp. CF418]|uniref:hypothetical protein n=1 Tax=Chitinophaga sp. CF418 TaxID=1855287 RepID=UPI00091E9567|nr:hypothetical protein [Chitinophaga sp. CF418]SHN45572.1 hypothetical protein SAMN05216311_120114 [Chitinophaga sp. CF418]
MQTMILENDHEAKCIDENTVFYNGLNCDLLTVGDGSYTLKVEQEILRVIGCTDVVDGYGIKMYWNTIHGYDLLLPYVRLAIRKHLLENAVAFHCYSGTCFIELKKDFWLISEDGELTSLPTAEDMRAFIREREAY